jgi:hypothetical protein
VTRRSSPLLIAACVVAATALVPSDADAQGRRGPRAAARAAVIVGSPYYYGPAFYDRWYPSYWYPSPYYYTGRYYDSASLRLQVTPRQAEVFVDGYYAGIVDDFDGTFQRLDLEPGEHDVQLFLSGYRPVTQRIYLQPRNTFRVRLTMEPLGPGEPQPPRPGPEDAALPASGAQSATREPGAVSAPGALRRPGRTEAPRRGNPPQAGTQRNSNYGTLAIRVQPGDAEVQIDGERWQGTSDDERLVVQLGPGPHRIEVRKEGFRTFSTEVTIRSGETAPLNVSLAR